jgi:exonuclease III
MIRNGLFSVLTLNVGGFKSRPAKVIEVFETVKLYNFITIQETHFHNVNDSSFFNSIFEPHFDITHSYAEKRFSGICMLRNKNFSFDKHEILFTIRGRCVCSKFIFSQTNVIAVAIYAPAKRHERMSFFERLKINLENITTPFSEMFVLGDFNFVERPEIDRCPAKMPIVEPGYIQFSLIENRFVLADVYRNLYAEKPFFTFTSSQNSLSRIDRLHCTSGLLRDVSKCESILVSSLQHKAFLVTFRINSAFKRGLGVWKMNTLLLENDKTMFNNIEKMLVDFLEDSANFSGKKILDGWEILKQEIAEFSKIRSRFLAKEKRKRKILVCNEIESLRIKIGIYRNSDFLNAELNCWINKLKILEQDEIKSRLHNTHYKNLFYDRHNLQSAKQAQISSASDRLMSSLKTENGGEVFEQNLILEELERQFSNLFKRKNSTGFEYYFNSTNPPSIFQNYESAGLSSPIQLHEVDEAIKLLKKQKSPGSDGLPAELYQKFHEPIKKILLKLFNECFKLGFLSESMYKGVITLIYKGKGDRSIRSNWRPITLLNSDYKILMKILYNRLKPFTPKLINQNQTCGIPGRNIQDGIYSLYSVILKMRENNENGIILSVDQKSAFDIIEWEFLEKSLGYFSIPTEYRKWFSIIYRENCVKSVVTMNGHCTRTINVTRGVRQGCPLSPILYILGSEVFCNKIRSNTTIIGVELAGNLLKLSNYADDTNFLVKNFESVDTIFQEYEKFSKSSGAIVNTDKTQILLLGKKPNTIPQQYSRNLVEKLKIYGIVFDKTGFDVDSSYESAKKSVEKLLNTNPHSEFSYESRASFINTYFLSKFWYVAHFITPNENLKNLVNKAITKFLWCPSRKPKIKGAIIFQSRKNGGIGIQNIDIRIKTIRLMFLIRANKVVASDWLTYFKNRIHLLRTQLIGNRIDPFHKELLTVENAYNFNVSRSKVSITQAEFDLGKITSKIIYETICKKKFSRDIELSKNRWKKMLNLNEINFSECYANNFLIGVDPLGKDLHYVFVNNALQTNDRISKWKVNVSPNCNFCERNGKSLKETNIHAILECERVTIFWSNMTQYFQTFNVELGKVEKVFGLTVKHDFKNILNILLQTAQKVVWLTRVDFNNTNIQIDIWKTYKKRLKNLLRQRNKMFMSRQHEIVLERIECLIPLQS